MFLSIATARAASVKDELPFQVEDDFIPAPVTPGPWRFFTIEESQVIEAIVDRLIPPDPDTPGGKDAGCAVFIDRQLVGGYGRFDGHYMFGPFAKGSPQQGDQAPQTPAERYRLGLDSLDRYCRKTYGGETFQRLTSAQQDQILTALEHGTINLDSIDSKLFFKLLLTDTQSGFFADPIYGGNKDMVAWKMIGFPGARYDYRDWIDHHNETYPLPPIGLREHPTWDQ